MSQYCSSREPSSTCTVQWQCPRMSSGAVCVCVYHGLALAPWPTLKNTMSHQGTEIRQLEFAQKMIQSDTHQGRLEYFKDILDEEYRASIAKKSLKNLWRALAMSIDIDVQEIQIPFSTSDDFLLEAPGQIPGLAHNAMWQWCDHMKLDQPRDRGKCLEMSRKWCQDVPRPCDRLVFPLSGWMVVIGCVTMTIAANAKKEKRDAVVRHATTCMLPSPNTLDRPCAGWSFADIQPRMEKSNIPFTSFYYNKIYIYII